MAKLDDEGSFHRVLGFTEGTFTTIIDTLTINQPYFFRGYAINSNGIAYDTYDVVSVTNIPVTGVVCPNTMTDLRNGKSYSVVLIGDQCWMAENLNVGEMVPGVLIWIIYRVVFRNTVTTIVKQIAQNMGQCIHGMR